MSRNNKRHRVNDKSALPNKRRRVDIAFEEMKPGDDVSNNYSPDDDACLNKVLQRCTLIVKMEMPSVIIDTITKFGRGDVVECRKCKKEDHVDDIKDLPERLDVRGDWIHDKYEDVSLCSACYDESLCTFCNDNVSEDNYKCYDCNNVVCPNCETHWHMEEHMRIEYMLSEEEFIAVAPW